MSPPSNTSPAAPTNHQVSPPRSPPTTTEAESQSQGHEQGQNVPIEADSESNDSDSALGEGDRASLTTSLASSIFNYTYENGRRYHAYREGQYLFPNDDTEQDRLDMLHHIFGLILRGRLFKAPIDRDLHRILDFGTGTGIWAIDVAE